VSGGPVRLGIRKSRLDQIEQDIFWQTVIHDCRSVPI
jgi:hypothetical protein